MTSDEMIEELNAKLAAVDAERKRRNAAIHKAMDALRECCRKCSRVGLCASERCAVRYALKYKPMERVLTLSDRICKNGHDGFIDESGTVHATNRGRHAHGKTVIDDIRL